MNESLVVMVRGIIGFFTLLIFARILGKQQVSQLTLFEYVLGITIGSSAATLTTELDSTAWSHFVGLFTWTFMVFCMQLITYNSQKAMRYINGVPEIIIMNGKILENKMKSLRYSLNDLLEQLRIRDVFDIQQVEFAILETNGQLTVLKKTQFQAVTPAIMKIPTEYEGISYELIMFGKIIKKNLQAIHKTEEWLMNVLHERKVDAIETVYFASINSKGELFINFYTENDNNGYEVSNI